MGQTLWYSENKLFPEMPLELKPPSSPVGKSSPPPSKHHCDCSSATWCCDIPISQIGCRFHYIPKTHINMVFFPPSVPAWVICYIKAHPQTWTWKLHTGPRAGTVLTVPTVPIHCPGDAHRTVKWLVSVFHLFKSSLHQDSSFTSDGQVLPCNGHILSFFILSYQCVYLI